MATLGKAAAAVSVLLLSVALATGFYLSQTNGPASSSTTTQSTSIFTSSVGPTDSSLGLDLEVYVNSTTIPSQDAFSITATLVNTLPTANNLTAADEWALPDLSAGPCSPQGNATDKLFFPVGIGILKGNYGLGNISSAGRPPLPAWALAECPADFVTFGGQHGVLKNITSYSLLAGSSNGNYTGSFGVPGPQPPPVCSGGVCTYAANTVTYAKGVFATTISAENMIFAANGTSFSSYNSLDSALPANYTLVAGDEWGQISLVHFEVVPSSNLPRVGSFLANSLGCDEDGYTVPCITSQFSNAFIFNCAAAAAAPSGCTTQVPNPKIGYTITARYPVLDQAGEPAGDNCMFSVKGDTTPPYAYCFMVNATAFAMTM